MARKGGLWTTQTSSPTILQINHESRDIGFELYKGVFLEESISSANPYIYTALDTVAVVIRGGKWGKDSTEQVRQLCHGASVKYLALLGHLAFSFPHNMGDLKLFGLDFIHGVAKFRHAFVREGCGKLYADEAGAAMLPFLNQEAIHIVSFWILRHRGYNTSANATQEGQENTIPSATLSNAIIAHTK